MPPPLPRPGAAWHTCDERHVLSCSWQQRLRWGGGRTPGAMVPGGSVPMGRATLAAAFSGKPCSKSAAWLLLLGPPSHGGGLGGSRTPRTAPRGSSPSPPSLPHHGGSRCPLLPAPHRAPTFALFLPPSPGEGGGGHSWFRRVPPTHTPSGTALGGPARAAVPGWLPSAARSRGGGGLPVAGAAAQCRAGINI